MQIIPSLNTRKRRKNMMSDSREILYFFHFSTLEAFSTGRLYPKCKLEGFIY